jgi:hypothetical protein
MCFTQKEYRGTVFSLGVTLKLNIHDINSGQRKWDVCPDIPHNARSLDEV